VANQLAGYTGAFFFKKNVKTGQTARKYKEIKTTKNKDRTEEAQCKLLPQLCSLLLPFFR
jgi:hypothetical protein